MAPFPVPPSLPTLLQPQDLPCVCELYKQISALGFLQLQLLLSRMFHLSDVHILSVLCKLCSNVPYYRDLPTAPHLIVTPAILSYPVTGYGLFFFIALNNLTVCLSVTLTIMSALWECNLILFCYLWCLWHLSWVWNTASAQ